jgi:hypothetical protein
VLERARAEVGPERAVLVSVLEPVDQREVAVGADRHDLGQRDRGAEADVEVVRLLRGERLEDRRRALLVFAPGAVDQRGGLLGGLGGRSERGRERRGEPESEAGAHHRDSFGMMTRAA